VELIITHQKEDMTKLWYTLEKLENFLIRNELNKLRI